MFKLSLYTQPCVCMPHLWLVETCHYPRHTWNNWKTVLNALPDLSLSLYFLDLVKWMSVQVKLADPDCCAYYYHQFILSVPINTFTCNSSWTHTSTLLGTSTSQIVQFTSDTSWNFTLYSWNATWIFRLVLSTSNIYFHSFLVILLTPYTENYLYHEVTATWRELPIAKCLCCSTDVGRWPGLCCYCSESRFSTRTTVRNTIEAWHWADLWMWLPDLFIYLFILIIHLLHV